MSRKTREIQKTFKVFCEGDTEFNYIDEMRRQKKLSISLKLVNMKGGGYRSFLEQVQIDGTTNCLAKFILIDGDKAISDEGEKKNLRELLEYCRIQNQSERIPHFQTEIPKRLCWHPSQKKIVLLSTIIPLISLYTK